MSKLAEQSCEACKADAARVTKDEYQELLTQIPEWQIISMDSIDRLNRIFKFDRIGLCLTYSWFNSLLHCNCRLVS